MAVALNTPMAEALSHRIQPKLVEIGWSVGEDDSSPLSEYICLMLVNGKSQSQIASELSGDLLGLGQDDSSTTEFAKWLFAQVEELQKESGGQAAPQQQEQNASADGEQSGQMHQEHHGDMDMDMGMGDVDERVPTGPKAMRNPNLNGAGNRRMMNQLSRAMERRPEDRMRPQGGGIDKNQKFNNAPRGPMNNRGNMNRFNNGRGGPQNRMNNGRNNNFNAMAGFNTNMTPEQQMQFYQMFQQQAQMMTPFVNGPMPPMPGNNGGMRGGRGNHMGNNFGMPHHGGNGPHHHQRGGFQNNNFQNHRNQGNANGNGSLFDRIQAPPDLSQAPEGTMAEDRPNDEGMDATSTTSSKHNSKPEEVPCKFGTGCTKPECIFGHPTPAAPHNRGILYVSGERCPFGSSCKNRKCTGSHPSPAAAPNFHGAGGKKIEQDCRFFPNCTNPNCQFRHPPMPMCRNGANCTRPDCHFSHTEIACRYTPCLNPNCSYKHEEGQQQAPPENGFSGHKVWKAPGSHVSERKFVNEQAEEELIIPGQGAASGSGGGNDESGEGQGEGLDTAEMLDEGVDDML